ASSSCLCRELEHVSLLACWRKWVTTGTAMRAPAACRLLLAPRRFSTRAGRTRKPIDDWAALSPGATRFINLLTAVGDGKPGPGSTTGANELKARVIRWPFVPWPIFGHASSWPFGRKGSCTKPPPLKLLSAPMPGVSLRGSPGLVFRCHLTRGNHSSERPL